MSHLNTTIDPQLAEYKVGINAAAATAIKQLNPDKLPIKDKVVLALKQVVMFFVDVEPKNAAEAAFHKVQLTEVLTALLAKVERMMATGKELEAENKTLWEENLRLKKRTEMLKAKNQRLEAKVNKLAEDNGRPEAAQEKECADCQFEDKLACDCAEDGVERGNMAAHEYGQLDVDATPLGLPDPNAVPLMLDGELQEWLGLFGSPEWARFR